MPEPWAKRQNLLKTMGAQLVLTEGAKGMKGAIEKAEELRDRTLEPSFWDNSKTRIPPPMQYHCYRKYGNDTDGKVDIFVAESAGSTLSGERIKTESPYMIVAVSRITPRPLSGGNRDCTRYKVSGRDLSLIPTKWKLVDKIIRVKDDDAIRTGRELSLTEGLLVGTIFGSSCLCRMEPGQTPENEGKQIVVILPDTGNDI